MLLARLGIPFFICMVVDNNRMDPPPTPFPMPPKSSFYLALLYCTSMSEERKGKIKLYRSEREEGRTWITAAHCTVPFSNWSLALFHLPRGVMEELPERNCPAAAPHFPAPK